MDNCNIEKLSCKPGKISPKFHKDVLEYFIILSVKETKTVLDFFAEDSGASYDIKCEGGDGSKTISVNEGNEKIVSVVVTAEDGKTTKTYKINVKRHSAKAAILESLEFSNLTLNPDFKSEIYCYQINCSLKTDMVTIVFKVPDATSKVLINKSNPLASYPLNLGSTLFNLNVTSPDGSNNKSYDVIVSRDSVPFYIELSDVYQRYQYEDPLSLSPCLDPVDVQQNTVYDFLEYNTSKQLLRLQRMPSSIDADKCRLWDQANGLSNCSGKALLNNFTLSDNFCLNKLGSILSINIFHQELYASQFGFTPFHQTMNLTPEWQAKLSLKDSTQSEAELNSNLQSILDHYFTVRPSTPNFIGNQSITNKSPSKLLFDCIELTATLIGKNKNQSKYHFLLAQLLEEYFLLGDILNEILVSTKLLEDNSAVSGGAESKSVICAKQDEILAICQLHGFKSNPSDTEQMLALDKEYHSLLAQNQSARADAIQNLYEWKSKRTSQDSAMRSEVGSETSLLGRSFYHYKCALSLDKKSTSYNFNVARFMMLQGKFKEAIELFHTALSGDKSHSASKFCLGSSMLLLASNPAQDKTSIEAMNLIIDSCTAGLNQMQHDAYISLEFKAKFLHDESVFFNYRNPIVSKGLLQLAKCHQVKIHPKFVGISPQMLFHWCLMVASRGWNHMGPGSMMHQLESIIVECHHRLLCLLPLEDPPAEIIENIANNRCLWIFNFVRSGNLPLNDELVQFLERSCEVCLYFHPTEWIYLANYGDILSIKADNMIMKDDKFSQTIALAIDVLLIALAVKQNKDQDKAKLFVANQAWYKSRKLLIYDMRPPQAPTPAKSVPIPTTTAKPLAKPANKPAQTNKSPTTKPVATPAAKKPTANAPAASKKSGPPAPASAQQPPSKSTGKINLNSSTESTKEEPKTEDTAIKSLSALAYKRGLTPGKYVEVHRLERLIGRAYSINQQYDESVKYFKMSGIDQNVQEMTDVLQEYLDTLQLARDYETALSIYYKLRVNEVQPDFNDGYICGEIVRLIMKTEKYKDPNLVKYATLWAKIFGFGIIEKEIKILEDKSCSDVCKSIYASVHNKSVDDPSIQMFFQSRCWI